jgi:PTS system glucose-specific IIA component
VLAPVAGRLIGLDAVPDRMFAAGMLGPGAAIDPERGPMDAVAPVAGRLIALHPHAYVIETPDGAAVLVHLGVDTVQLGGQGFELHAAAGADVAAGQPIVRWDAAAVEAGGRSPVCPVVAMDAEPAQVSVVPELQVSVGALLFSWNG